MMSEREGFQATVRWRGSVGACALAAAMLAAPAAFAAESIGSAVTVVNLVTAKLETQGDPRRLANGDDVRRQELIEVDENSRSEIELNDRTKLALGPGSRLLLDQFVYDPDISGGAIVMDLVRGTFRFITGIAAKPAYVIRTPAASITVRGTIFDVFVKGRDETWLLLLEGAVEVCVENGNCLLHDEPGKLIRITAQDIDKPVRWAGLRNGGVDFDAAFPFVAEPPLIDPEPIFTREDIVYTAPPAQKKTYEKTYDEPRPKPPASKPKRTEKYDDYKSDWKPRKVKKRRHREYDDYPRETHNRRGSRAGKILKAGVAVGVGVGIGIGVGKLFKKKY